jgi:transcriptional regulator with XRE-family HTH domain
MRFNLIKFRRSLKLSQTEVANRLGVSRPHYSDIENGKVSPSIDFAYKIQEAFDIDDVMELLKKE